MGFLSKNSNFNIVSGEGYNVDTTSGDITGTLPAANTIKSPIVLLNGTGANNILLSGTINGQNGYSIASGKSLVISSDGTTIFISGGNG